MKINEIGKSGPKIKERILDKDFSKYLTSADETSVVLKCHLAIERFIDKLISEAVPNPKKIQSMTFSSKINILNAMGLVGTKTTNKVLNFNKLRNKFSHEYNYVLNEEDIKFLDSCIPAKIKLEGNDYEIIIQKIVSTMAHILTLLEVEVNVPAARDASI